MTVDPGRFKEFSLEPFRGEGTVPDLNLTGSIGRRANLLSVRYALRGELSELAIPAPEAYPRRRDRLSEETCLEFFLGVKDSQRYWEFNLSPAGHWNVYRFASYREGMQKEPAFTSLPFGVRMEPWALELTLALAVEKIIPAGTSMDLGVSAVIKTMRGEVSHWALAHSGPRPDFHRRDDFTLDLSAEA